MTLNICLHVLVYVEADLTYVLAGPVVGNCRHYHHVVYRIESVSLYRVHLL